MRSYQADYAGWAEDTAKAIADGRWSDIDRAALIDEVESLGKQERQRVISRLTVLLTHLLKRQFQPAKHCRSWEATILEQRSRLRDLIDDSPSLQPVLPQLLDKAYSYARLRAVRETGLALNTFPEQLPFSASEIWGED